jgi:ubiquinone/menaquinone biosynthesis C-methylase UbiE
MGRGERVWWDEEAKEWDDFVSNPQYSNYYTYKTIDFHVLENIKGRQEVLELSCGTGGLLQAIHNRIKPKEYVGVDISEEMIRICKKKFGEERFFVADTCSLPFEDSSFDAVVSRGGALSHVENIKAALNEVYRVAKENARVYIDLFNKHKKFYVLLPERNFRLVETITKEEI